MAKIKGFGRVAGIVFLLGTILALGAVLMSGCGDETTTTPESSDTKATTTMTKEKDRTSTGAGEAEFKATLTGSEEVPPVQTEAKGEAEFKLSADGSTLTFEVKVEDISDIAASHIHMAAAGSNGPIVVSLFAGSKAGSFDGTLAEGTITAADLTGPLAGMTMDALVSELKAGNAYVNVHTVTNQPGEIRGQLRMK